MNEYQITPTVWDGDLEATRAALELAARRIARLEAQSETRRLDIEYWTERAKEFEARLEAVQRLVDYADMHGNVSVYASEIQWAIDGKE